MALARSPTLASSGEGSSSSGGAAAAAAATAAAAPLEGAAGAEEKEEAAESAPASSDAEGCWEEEERVFSFFLFREGEKKTSGDTMAREGERERKSLEFWSFFLAFGRGGLFPPAFYFLGN